MTQDIAYLVRAVSECNISIGFSCSVYNSDDRRGYGVKISCDGVSFVFTDVMELTNAVEDFSAKNSSTSQVILDKWKSFRVSEIADTEPTLHPIGNRGVSLR